MSNTTQYFNGAYFIGGKGGTALVLGDTPTQDWIWPQAPLFNILPIPRTLRQSCNKRSTRQIILHTIHWTSFKCTWHIPPKIPDRHCLLLIAIIRHGQRWGGRLTDYLGWYPWRVIRLTGCTGRTANLKRQEQDCK